jgi:Restriction endonuclease
VAYANDDPEQLGTILARIRASIEHRALSADEIASSVGVSPAYLQSCLAGKRRLAPSRLVIACREVGIDFSSVAATLDSVVGETTLLRQTRAARPYECSYCGSAIGQSAVYVRLGPFGLIRQAGTEALHFCRSCSVLGNWLHDPLQPHDSSSETDDQQLILPFAQHIKPTRVQLVDISDTIWTRILANPDELFRLNPPQFEEFVLERLRAMGLDAQPVGKTFRKDGGIDIIFTPPRTFPFPFLGAVQAKHHRDPRYKVGPRPVRELEGVLAANRHFAAGMIVTNTTFTPDAKDFAKRSPSSLRLRDFQDLRRWIADNFTDDAEWREIPNRIQLCDGISIDLS